METQRLGTSWTGDGEGATVGKLDAAALILCDVMGDGHAAIYDAFRAAGYRAGVVGYCHAARTNLRLTGEPLTAEDIERILSPEFKVGGGK